MQQHAHRVYGVLVTATHKVDGKSAGGEQSMEKIHQLEQQNKNANIEKHQQPSFT